MEDKGTQKKVEREKIETTRLETISFSSSLIYAVYGYFFSFQCHIHSIVDGDKIKIKTFPFSLSSAHLNV